MEGLRPPRSEQQERQVPAANEEGWDERVIREGIEAALAEERSIDDRTARYIAGQLHGGQESGLYALASSGAITDSVVGELVNERLEQEPGVRAWIDALISYCAQRPDSGPVDGWVEQAEAGDRADLMAQIAEGGVATLGDLAAISVAEPSEPVEEERDSFPWSDAAHWSPEHAAAGEIGLLTDEALDALYEMDPDEEVGDVSELGWYGLLRGDDRPGGYITTLDAAGTRHVLEYATDTALADAWSSVTSDYERYYAEREAYENATLEAGDSYRGIGPQIWVGSLSDYNDGRLHGEWFDATCDAHDLELAARFMLRGSRAPNAEEWAVMDYDGFGVLRLGEYASFETISRIAQGIAEHGEAFAAWAAHVGPDSGELLDRFEDHYLGEWESFEAYVKDYLEESEFYRFLEYVAEDMRGYIEVDTEQIARDWSSDYEIAERPDGGVWVFSARG